MPQPLVGLEAADHKPATVGQNELAIRDPPEGMPVTASATDVSATEQRLMLLGTWRRSGLPAKDFAALVGISKRTLYKWNQLLHCAECV